MEVGVLCVWAYSNKTKLHSRANLAPNCTLHTNEPANIGCYLENRERYECWKPFKLQPRVGLWRSSCTGTPFNLCGRFGLSCLQHNPVGIHVTGNAFIAIDFNNQAGFGFA